MATNTATTIRPVISTSSNVVTPSSPTATASTGTRVPKYGQCGGIGWTGGKLCVSGSTCTEVNDCTYFNTSSIPPKDMTELIPKKIIHNAPSTIWNRTGQKEPRIVFLYIFTL